MIHYKSFSGLEIKADEESGVFSGYASTFGGDPDAVGDVVSVGAFSKSLEEHRREGTVPKMLWQHRIQEPIGVWLSLEEDKIGLKVEGRLAVGVRRADEALALLKAGALDGMSIGYRINKYTSDTETGIWYLDEIDLQEISLVTIGANPQARVQEVKGSPGAFLHR